MHLFFVKKFLVFSSPTGGIFFKFSSLPCGGAKNFTINIQLQKYINAEFVSIDKNMYVKTYDYFIIEKISS